MKKKRATKKDVLINKIKVFFAKSRVKSFDLNELGTKFVLDEDGLFDTEVNIIDEQGIGIDGENDFRGFKAVEVEDLEYIVKTVLPQLKALEPEVYKQNLINKVIDEIQRDLASGDLEPLDELLKFLPDENLIAYLPEKKP